MTDLCFESATTLARLIREREVSAREVTMAHLARIDRINPAVNAIVTLVPERALAAAERADQALGRGEPIGPLHGLPIAHKDLQETAGIRTTYGSPIYRDLIPAADSLLVQRCRAAGAICLGKTNTPEFGAGSQTFNPVFGATRNPYALDRTVGGSSGGAAAALATGMLPIADGSDMGGSLRNPASFCNVVGIRPSPGRVPSQGELGWFTLAVDGPMARTVADAALLLSALAGPDPRSPISLEIPGERFRQPLGRDFAGVRLAWTGGCGLPFEPDVVNVVDRHRQVFESLGLVVEDAAPDLAGLDEAFLAWRAWYFEMALGPEYAKTPDLLKDSIRWNVEAGRAITGPDLARAEVGRTAAYHRVRRFMERYQFFVLPTVQVLPFSVDQPYPTEIDGRPMASYLDWMRSCYLISALGNPCISVPAGFSAAGLPVGLQIVGRHRDDWGVLQLAHAFEQAAGGWRPAASAESAGGAATTTP
ncbi:MAG: amidase [Gemmatimonadetes bacterium]|nr:amidase [Gemmatimonadota bacterium]